MARTIDDENERHLGKVWEAHSGHSPGRRQRRSGVTARFSTAPQSSEEWAREARDEIQLVRELIAKVFQELAGSDTGIAKDEQDEAYWKVVASSLERRANERLQEDLRALRREARDAGAGNDISTWIADAERDACRDNTSLINRHAEKQIFLAQRRSADPALLRTQMSKEIAGAIPRPLLRPGVAFIAFLGIGGGIFGVLPDALKENLLGYYAAAEKPKVQPAPDLPPAPPPSRPDPVPEQPAPKRTAPAPDVKCSPEAPKIQPAAEEPIPSVTPTSTHPLDPRSPEGSAETEVPTAPVDPPEIDPPEPPSLDTRESELVSAAEESQDATVLYTARLDAGDHCNTNQKLLVGSTSSRLEAARLIVLQDRANWHRDGELPKHGKVRFKRGKDDEKDEVLATKSIRAEKADRIDLSEEQVEIIINRLPRIRVYQNRERFRVEILDPGVAFVECL